MMNRLFRLISIAGLAAALGLTQTGGAPVQGTVTDATGAAVPGAEITLTQIATSVGQKTRSNATGLYVFPASPIGDYVITVTSPGMEKWQGKVTLQAGLTAVVNVPLKVGSASTQVTVADVTPIVDVTSPTISERLDRQRIEQFPVSDAMGLVAAMTPGFEGGGSSPRAFGLRNDSAELTVDGAPTSNRSEGGTQGAAPE